MCGYVCITHYTHRDGRAPVVWAPIPRHMLCFSYSLTHHICVKFAVVDPTIAEPQSKIIAALQQGPSSGASAPSFALPPSARPKNIGISAPHRAARRRLPRPLPKP